MGGGGLGSELLIYILCSSITVLVNCCSIYRISVIGQIDTDPDGSCHPPTTGNNAAAEQAPTLVPNPEPHCVALKQPQGCAQGC